MARLALVRKRREEAEARKAEEGKGDGTSAKEKMEKEAKAKAGSGGPQKLNPLEVKTDSEERSDVKGEHQFGAWQERREAQCFCWMNVTNISL